MSVELAISKLMTGYMGQMSGVGQVSRDGPMDELLTQAMQTLTINPQTEIDQPQQSRPSREKKIVWQGVIGWQEKSKIAIDHNGKVQREVPCQVSSTLTTVGEPEVNGEKWPKKLIMQLIPKALMLQFGTMYLQQSRHVIFHFSKNMESSDALSSLKEIMHTGFVGCVHFPKEENLNCDLRILMLVPINHLHTYVGFIPNDQTGFIAKIRSIVSPKVQTIRHRKQDDLVLQQAQQQLVELQRGPDNRPVNMLRPGMDDPSDYWASRRGGRRFTWPRSRGGISHGSNVTFVAERSSPYDLVHITGMMVPHSVTATESQQNLMKIEQLRQSQLPALLKETEKELVLLRQLRLQQPLLPGNNTTNTSIPQLRQLLQLSHPTMLTQQGSGQLSSVDEMGQGPGNGQPPPTNPGGSIFPDDVK